MEGNMVDITALHEALDAALRGAKRPVFFNELRNRLISQHRDFARISEEDLIAAIDAHPELEKRHPPSFRHPSWATAEVWADVDQRRSKHTGVSKAASERVTYTEDEDAIDVCLDGEIVASIYYDPFGEERATKWARDLGRDMIAWVANRMQMERR